MDFFQHQETARRKTGLLVFYFVVAVVLIVLLANALQCGMVWRLDPGLVQWAYQMTRDTPLPDNDLLRAARAGYAREPMALRPPFVLIGDNLSTTRFWHGERRTVWARDWVKIWTDGTGVFATTDCEDQGFLDVLQIFSKEGRVDLKRVLVLRTASNYCTPPPGAAVISTIGDESTGTVPALEACYRVGSVVAHELLEHWDRYSDRIPSR